MLVKIILKKSFCKSKSCKVLIWRSQYERSRSNPVRIDTSSRFAFDSSRNFRRCVSEVQSTVQSSSQSSPCRRCPCRRGLQVFFYPLAGSAGRKSSLVCAGCPRTCDTLKLLDRFIVAAAHTNSYWSFSASPAIFFFCLFFIILFSSTLLLRLIYSGSPVLSRIWSLHSLPAKVPPDQLTPTYGYCAYRAYAARILKRWKYIHKTPPLPPSFTSGWIRRSQTLKKRVIHFVDFFTYFSPVRMMQYRIIA